jgi:hypothetical protein
MNSGRPLLGIALSERKSELASKWLDQMLLMYPKSSASFLLSQQDQFQNPVGYRLKEGLAILFDWLIQPEEAVAAQPVLERLIKIQAVQDISSSRAVAFVFLLKRILRAELAEYAVYSPDEFASIDFRIDEMALLAFDLFMKCREQIYEIKANESKRMAFLMRRMEANEE